MKEFSLRLRENEIFLIYLGNAEIARKKEAFLECCREFCISSEGIPFDGTDASFFHTGRRKFFGGTAGIRRSVPVMMQFGRSAVPESSNRRGIAFFQAGRRKVSIITGKGVGKEEDKFTGIRSSCCSFSLCCSCRDAAPGSSERQGIGVSEFQCEPVKPIGIAHLQDSDDNDGVSISQPGVPVSSLRAFFPGFLRRRDPSFRADSASCWRSGNF